MPRLFTGLEIPADLALSLSMLRGGLPGARWISPENYHITLRFIGDVDDRMADEIDAMLCDLEYDMIDVTLNGLGTFGGDKPHSIFVSIEPNRALNELQAAQERTLRRLGLPPETRRFTPHVTLARLRHSSTIDVADYLATHTSPSRRSFEARRFVLFSSKASVGGGPYIVEAGYPLGQMSFWDDFQDEEEIHAAE